MSIRGTAVSRVSISGARGEADIVAQFHARHLELVRLAALLLGDSAAAEDVVQDVFTRVWEGRYRRLCRLARRHGAGRADVRHREPVLDR